LRPVWGEKGEDGGERQKCDESQDHDSQESPIPREFHIKVSPAQAADNADDAQDAAYTKLTNDGPYA